MDTAPLPLQPALDPVDEISRLKERILQLEQQKGSTDAPAVPKKRPSVPGLHPVNNARNKILQLKGPHKSYITKYKDKNKKPDSYEVYEKLVDFFEHLEEAFDEHFPLQVEALDRSPIVRKRKPATAAAAAAPSESRKKQKRKK